MSTKHLSLKPHDVQGSQGTVWWYEENKGMCLVVAGVGLKQYYIPWETLRAALKRKDKK